MSEDNDKKWLLLQSKLHEEQAIKAFEIFRGEGVEPILIKGIAISLKYPDDHLRISFDIDLAVSPSEFQKARTIANSGIASKINMDIHKGLRHFDTTDWSVVFERSKEIKLGNGTIRILSEEDHLRVLCVHWLTDGGENKEKLWDIYYAVKNRASDFDWQRCLEKANSNRRMWTIYTIGIASGILGLDTSDTPISNEIKNMPKWIIRYLEKIWKKPYPFIPLDACFNDPKMFFYQVKKRIPPNPIMATIGVDGDLSGAKRYIYQAKYFLQRAKPSLTSMYKFVTLSSRNRKTSE